MWPLSSKLLAKPACPIGIEIGRENVRLIQLRHSANGWEVLAARRIPLTADPAREPAEHDEQLLAALRELSRDRNLQGRQACLTMPADSTLIQHLRIAKADEADIAKALPWEVRDKLPIDPERAVLRHVTVGELSHDGQPMLELICFATPKSRVRQIMTLASKARFDVINIGTQAQAVVDCFHAVYRRKADETDVLCYVDIGSVSTRVTVSQAGRIMFARSIPLGGEHFNQAVATTLSLTPLEARQLRADTAATLPAETAPTGDPLTCQMPLIPAAPVAQRRDTDLAFGDTEADRSIVEIDAALKSTVARLIDELNLCRRYHESTLPAKPIGRLVFIGGEASQRRLCRQIARSMHLAAQVGDPMVRLGNVSGIEALGVRPAWAAAIGMSVGNLVSAWNAQEQSRTAA